MVTKAERTEELIGNLIFDMEKLVGRLQQGAVKNHFEAALVEYRTDFKELFPESEPEAVEEDVEYIEPDIPLQMNEPEDVDSD